MKKKLKIISRFISFIFVMITLSIMLVTYDFTLKKYDIPNAKLVVEKEDTFSNIYKRLGMKYTILDKIFFRITKYSKYLKRGTYNLENKMTKIEFVEYIAHNEPHNIVLIIPEGFTTNKILDRIENLKLATKKEMLSALSRVDFYYPHNNNFEGYFLPSTYEIPENATADEIVKIILDNFINKFPPDKYRDKNAFYNNLILASIVELEVNKEEDKAKVAQVFKNRLKIDMLLQSDATLKYTLNRQAYKKELQESDSKYNTYKHKGLTPTPVSNPGYTTIINSMKNINFPYYYFFMYNNKTYYAKTHEEHLRLRKNSGQIK